MLDTFVWVVVIVELVLMTSLLVISSTFLIQSCRSKQKTASFIVKLLILVSAVAISGIGNAIETAPWWRRHASSYYHSIWDVLIYGAIEIIYWVAAQWSTWIIAF